MADRSPRQIEEYLAERMPRMDLPVQYLGDEPNSYRKPWDTTSVRWLVMASWAYEAAAGNQSVPAVYKAVNIGREDFLCDRFYLPATPRDLKSLQTAGIPVFGIESKHQAADFDVVATSISYSVLAFSFVKMLSMSDIPVRRVEREEAGPGNFPMVMVGGQSYGAPEFLAPVIDCFWLGEVEDEPGQPGIAAVTARIAEFKESGLWTTDRVACYAELAREFDFLYFPRFIDVRYAYEDRTHVEVGLPVDPDGEPVLSKQVVGYTSNLEGMVLPRVKRHVKDMDAIVPLDNQPLLYADPGMGAGDLEVGRGNIGSCEYVLVEGEGLRRFSSWVGDDLHPHGADLGKLRVDVAGTTADVTHVLMNGERGMVKVTTETGHTLICTPDHELSIVRGPAVGDRPSHNTYVPPELRGPTAFGFKPGRRLEAIADQPLRWVRADAVVSGEDYFPVYYGQNVWSSALVGLDVDIPLVKGSISGPVGLPSVLDEDVAWFLGMLAGDVSIRSNGDVAQTSSVYVRMQAEDPGVAARGMEVLLRLFGRELEPWARNAERPDRVTLEIRSSQLTQWLARNFGITDNENRRRVPDAILRSPRQVVAAYLSGLFDSDGSYDHRTGRPLFYSSSHELMRVVSLLLLNLGAPCSLLSSTEKREGVPGTSSARRQPGQVIWKVQGLQAEDGDWSWLRPSHTRRLPHVLRWATDTGVRKGRTAGEGRIWSVVTSVEGAGTDMSYDISVPEFTSFTCSGFLVHNCPAWCSFCALSFRQKPYRQRSVPFMEKYAESAMLNMGATRLTPFMPDFPMHTQRKRLIASLLERVSDEVDAPAMRVDDFIADGDFVLLQVHGGMDGVTLGLEGNSQRMRDLVGKGTSDTDVKEAVALAIQAGIRKIKLFMITDLPGEDVGDVFRILRLAREIADIRDSMGQPNVRIQFSWTPLLIEANTPFQWFPVPSSTRTLGDVWEDFRDLKIEFKLGAKAEPNKAAFFQLCQRASRDVGEALVDTMLHFDVATWGGVPDGTRTYLEERLRAHGFHNGYEDCFDERDKSDMFGYEFVDQGVSVELLWQTFAHMREFAEQTDSDTYDTEFGPDYHGAEWIERCDSRCMGRTCGVCDQKDLKIRAGYIRAARTERDVDLSSLAVVDQRSLAFKVRARLDKAERYRLVQNDHWRFNLRRAAFQAQKALGWEHGIAKRTIRFASDTIKYHDWTSGTDYVEFAMTRIVDAEDLGAFIAEMNDRLRATPGDESTRWLRITDWTVLPGSAPLLRSDVDLSLFELEVDHDLGELSGLLKAWEEADRVPMVLRSSDAYFGSGSEEVDAKSYVDDIWVVRRGARYLLRMAVRGRPSPYNVYAAFTGKRSWRSVAGYPARRVDAFLDVEKGQGDFLRRNCVDCGFQIPVNVLDKPYHPDRCPRCLDRHEGVTVEEVHLV